MLKTECSICREWIDLPFAAGAPSVVCPRCSGTVEVRDVHIAAGPYMMHRDGLKRSIIKYKRLLGEAEKELEELSRREKGLGGEPTLKSVAMFVTHLKELLDGCRADQRYPLKRATEAECLYGGASSRCRLVNMSTSGLCLDAAAQPSLATLWSEVGIRLLKGGALLPGRVMWVGKGTLVGVRFGELPEKTREHVKDFIRENCLIIGI